MTTISRVLMLDPLKQRSPHGTSPFRIAFHNASITWAAPVRTSSMLDIAMERAHLAKADRGIAAGEERIRCQLLRIEAMRDSRLDLTQAEALLKTFRETLEVWRGHREEILSAIARLQATA